MSNYIETHYCDLINLKKVYPTPKGPFVVLDDFNLTIKQGEFVCLIGHSGCGKSTILSMVAGLNPISGGNVSLAGRELQGPGPDRGVVFQSPCLLPWLTAFQNVLLGVDQVYANQTRSDRRQIAQYYLNLVGLGSAIHKLPRELSNGMCQRVGIARAISLRPKMLLLDEPFGMLDSLTRYELQDVVVELLDESQITTLMVTHDVDEALFLSDRVVMMTNGPNAKVGDILHNTLPRPRSREVLMEHPDYYPFRERLIGFLEGQDHRHTAAADGDPADDGATAPQSLAVDALA